MPRQPRSQFDGALCHVFPRGNRRQRIAHTDRDYRILERYVIEAAEKSGVFLRCWYPMPNHFHAMVETPRGNLSEFMQRWLGRYARYHNRTHRKVGHLFQGRFGSRLVQKDAYQKELIRYITLQRHRSQNPESIDPYCDRYSSHRFYMGETCPAAVQKWITPMLELFGSTIDEARKNYAKFLADGLREGTWETFYKPRDGVVGDDFFVDSVQARKPLGDGLPKIPDRLHQKKLEELIAAICRLFDVHQSQLSSACQRRDLCRIRQAVAYVGSRYGIRRTLLAKALGRSLPALTAMIDNAERAKTSEIAALQKQSQSIFES
ncbi:MAG TPA: transposase [Elusimicrobiota bacterium]|nr:transposase [Elusimicrobiota bacterium]